VKPLIVKIGGSLAETGRLRDALEIVGRARRPTIIVPGGGPFADAVRSAQADLGFSDAAAHSMALLAMHQMAHLIVGLQPGLVAVETLEGMRRACAEKRIPVWLPGKLSEADRRIPRDWSITSDGLAARLAERLGRAPVLLLKSRPVERSASAAALARAGVVDPVFAEIVARAGLAWAVLGPGEEDELITLLGAGSRRFPGARAKKKVKAKRRRPGASVLARHYV
jgi:aspartokinase-like uncharacterized kinase